jgi:hypothetical protein
MKVGAEMVFVPADTVNQIQTTAQGIPSGFGEARSGGEELLKIMTQQLERFGEMAVQAATEQQRRFVVGRVADRSVAASDGTLIVSRGETITEQMAVEAERRGLLGELALAAGTNAARDIIDSLRGEARRIFSPPKKASEKVKVIDITDAEDSEESRINSVVGKPVKRIVLDREQRVILHHGDMVTHEKLEQARQAGVLEELLDAVSKEEPLFSEEERHHHTPGEIRQKRSEEGETRGENEDNSNR